MPRVTVVIATYNWSNVLPYSIGSVLRQTFSDWELLVVGDHCTDDSEQVVAQIKREHGDDARVRWINLPVNCGNQYGPNNEALRQARGELIAYLGHDDLWLPHHLESLVKAIDDGNDVVHSAGDWIYPNVEAYCHFPPELCTSPAMVMHRRSVSEQIGGWRDYREIEVPPDADLWQRARDAGFRFSFVPRLTVIKFPATARRDVYKARPCHEQKIWFERIGREPDLEAERLMALLCATHRTLVAKDRQLIGQLREILFWKIPLRVVAEVRHNAVARRARRALTKLKILPDRSRKGAQVRHWRRLKGLE